MPGAKRIEITSLWLDQSQKSNYATSLTNILSIPILAEPLDLPICLNMHVLILFLISVTAYATSRISNRFPRFQAANFGEMMPGLDQVSRLASAVGSSMGLFDQQCQQVHGGYRIRNCHLLSELNDS